MSNLPAKQEANQIVINREFCERAINVLYPGLPTAYHETVLMRALAFKQNLYLKQSIPIVFKKGKPGEKLSFIDTYPWASEQLRKHKGYMGINLETVYSNDMFKKEIGKQIPNHEYDLNGDRGDLVGAYCIIYFEGKNPMYFFRYKREVPKFQQQAQRANMSTESGDDTFMYNQMPDFMMMKVTFMAAVRFYCPEITGGGYAEEEIEGVRDVVIYNPDRQQKRTPPRIDTPKAEIDTELIRKIGGIKKAIEDYYSSTLEGNALEEAITNLCVSALPHFIDWTDIKTSKDYITLYQHILKSHPEIIQGKKEGEK